VDIGLNDIETPAKKKVMVGTNAYCKRNPGEGRQNDHFARLTAASNGYMTMKVVNSIALH
jgi:hypothetical protein